MPFGLGFFAAAGASSAAAPAFEHIETVTVGAGGQAEILFSNLDAYSSTYQHLQIRANARTTESGLDFTMRMRINGDTGTNYSYVLLGNVNLSSLESIGGTTQNAMWAGQLSGTSVRGSISSPTVLEILDAYQAKPKLIRSYTGNPTDNSIDRIRLISGSWNNNAAISSISLRSANLTNNFTQFSRFSIYGLRAS